MPTVFELEAEKAQDIIRDLERQVYILSLTAWALSHGWTTIKRTVKGKDAWVWRAPCETAIVQATVTGRWEAVPPLNEELIEAIEAQAKKGR
jgi:hypothetical protein